MSEEQNNAQEASAEGDNLASPQEESETSAQEAMAAEIQLQGFYAFKEGMSSVYGDNGEVIPVTVLRCQPWFVTQIKTKERDGYEAVQIAGGPKKAKNSSQAETARLKTAGFENGAQWVREIRQPLPEGVRVGQKVALDSLKKGDSIKIIGKSKGRGYSGVMKRWGFGGGPAAHGSKFHRRPGSIGNREWPGRVMPGRKLPGQFGHAQSTVPCAQVVEIIPDKNVVLVKGPVPGGRNTLVKLMKV